MTLEGIAGDVGYVCGRECARELVPGACACACPQRGALDSVYGDVDDTDFTGGVAFILARLALIGEDRRGGC